jgi:hypothetical protein
MRPYLKSVILLLLILSPYNKMAGQESITTRTDMQERDPALKNEFSRNAFYFEFLGPGLLYSVNYEYRFKNNLSLRAGFSAWSFDSLDMVLLQIKDLKYRSFPIMVNYLTGKRSSHLEFGLGLMPVFFKGDFTVFYFINAGENGRASQLVGLSTLGYRYQRAEGGIIFRACINPIFDTSRIYPIFGVSLGFGL